MKATRRGPKGLFEVAGAWGRVPTGKYVYGYIIVDIFYYLRGHNSIVCGSGAFNYYSFFIN